MARYPQQQRQLIRVQIKQNVVLNLLFRSRLHIRNKESGEDMTAI